MKLTRHARSRMRQRPGLSLDDVLAVVALPLKGDHDPDGRARYTGRIGKELVRVVVARDDPDLIVSVHRKRKL